MVMRIRSGVAGNAQLYFNALAADHELLRQQLVEYGTYIPHSMLGDQVLAKRLQEAIGPIVAEYMRDNPTQQESSPAAPHIVPSLQ